MEKEQLKQVLLLLIDIQNTSASTLGLYKKAENTQKCIEILCTLLEITEEEADELYWNSDLVDG